jgi:hypothetical protein
MILFNERNCMRSIDQLVGRRSVSTQSARPVERLYGLCLAVVFNQWQVSEFWSYRDIIYTWMIQVLELFCFPLSYLQSDWYSSSRCEITPKIWRKSWVFNRNSRNFQVLYVWLQFSIWVRIVSRHALYVNCSFLALFPLPISDLQSDQYSLSRCEIGSKIRRKSLVFNSDSQNFLVLYVWL